MNYTAAYDALIDRAKERVLNGYVEKHHIVPKCLGGVDSKINIVRLTAREHHVAHQLLIKIHPGVVGLTFAVVAMSGRKVLGRHASREYEWVRKRYSIEQSLARKGKPRPPEAMRAMRAAVDGVPKTAEHKAKISAARKGMLNSQQTKEKIAAAMRGRLVSTETRRRLSLARTGVPIPALLGNKSRTGMSNSPETRRLIALANTGKKHTPERKLNIALGNAKIPEDVVRAVRAEYASQTISQEKLAAKYGIGPSHISRIVRRLTYGWVE